MAEDQKVVVMNRSIPVEPVEASSFPVTFTLPVQVTGSVDVLSVPSKYSYDIQSAGQAEQVIALIKERLNNGWELCAWPTIASAGVYTLLVFRRPK